ncbi:unnamed protein product [Rhizophagus irregularis]|nr:unnamed protein product [Rhizophagus irregularis]
MLYSSNARFHISLIPARWYKDEILMKLNVTLENSPIIKAIESSRLFYNKENVQHIILQRNRFGIVFLMAKTAINIALETRSDNELQLIDQTTDLHVTRIRGAPCKKRIKSTIEISGKNRAIREITSQVNVQETDDGDAISRSQRKCLLYGKPSHYQKKCPGKSSIREEN